MINMLKNIDKQLINRWLNMSLILMFVGAAVLSYLGGNLNLFDLNTFIVLWIICALPFLFVAVTMYIQADKQKIIYAFAVLFYSHLYCRHNHMEISQIRII